MKTRIFVLGLFVSLALGVSARIFDAGERFYINMEAQSVKDAGGDLQYGWYSDMNIYPILNQTINYIHYSCSSRCNNNFYCHNLHLQNT